MSNRTEAATRKQRHGPPGGYSHCACSRLHQRGPSLCGWEAGPSPFCYVMHYRPIGVVGDSMSAALYIVLEKPIEGFKHFVNGKALAHASELLDTLAKKIGTKPLMNFWSAAPEELNGMAEDLGVTMKVNARPFSSERWFAATDGLATVQALRAAASAEKIVNLERVLADLDEFERVLNEANEKGVGWHLAVDF